MADTAITNCKGVTPISWPMAIDVRLLTKPEGVDVPGELFRRQVLYHLDHPDVAGPLKDLGEGHPPVLVVIADYRVLHDVPTVLAIDELARRDQSLFERRRGDHKLER